LASGLRDWRERIDHEKHQEGYGYPQETKISFVEVRGKGVKTSP